MTSYQPLDENNDDDDLMRRLEEETGDLPPQDSNLLEFEEVEESPEKVSPVLEAAEVNDTLIWALVDIML